MPKRKQGASAKGQYLMYKASNRWLNNRIKHFEAIVKKFPKDLQAAKYLNKLLNGSISYRRNRRGRASV